MTSIVSRHTLALTTALTLSLGGSAAFAQTTPGDQSGTALDAGVGQSAASSTQAPASTGQSPVGTTTPPASESTSAPTGNATPATPARQTGSRDQGEGAGDIVVTARRVEERLQDVPISITVFNQQQITNRNIVQSNDLATYTPSLSSNNNFGSQNSTFAIRGFVQDIGTQPSVGTYFADVVSPRAAASNLPIGDGAGPGNFFDLQNVQVLKGPQGTLFGRNTTGGAVLLVPQKPTSRFEGYVEGSYGNYDLKRIQGVLNVPFGDRARFRIGVDHEERDGYLKNDTGIGPSRFSDIDYTAIRASLVLDLTPDLENYTIVSYLHSNTVGDVQKIINATASGLGTFATEQLANEASKGAGFYTVQNSMPNPQTLLNQWQIINTTTWRATDNLTVKNITSYAQLVEDYQSPLFGTDFNLNRLAAEALAARGLPASLNPYPVGTVLGFASVVPIPGAHTADQSTFTEEVQLQGTNGALNWQAGGYLELSDPLGYAGSRSPVLLACTDYNNLVCTNPIGAGNVSYNPGKTNFRNYGLYAQGTYSLNDHFKVTGGFRYTWDRVNSFANLQNLTLVSPGVTTLAYCTNPDSTPPVCTASYKTRSQKPTWLIDLDYKPNEDILLYAKYARGYRAGGISNNAPTEYAVFQPEKVDSYEVGAKTEVRGPLRATFNVAGFYNDFSNQQLQINLNPKPGVAVTPATGIINAGKSRIYGAEVEASITPFTGLTLDASYTYLHTEIRKINIFQPSAASPYAADTPILPGDPLALSPKNKVSATATYTLPLSSDIGRVSVSGTFIHIDKQITNYLYRNGDGDLDSFSYVGKRNLVNLNLNWNSVLGSKFDVSAFATNVTNKKYYNFIPGLLNTVGFESATLGEPRFYGARLRYRFGA